MTIVLAFIGLAAGLAVASGVFALITILGVIPRMTDLLWVSLTDIPMETVIMLGGTAGNLLLIYEPHIPFGVVFLAVIGLFSGVYIAAFPWHWQRC